MPEASENQGDISPFTNSQWWTMFGDDVLNSLVKETLENNKDLQSAMAKVEEARAQLRISRADLMPSIGAGIQGSWGTVTSNGVLIEDPVQSYITGLSASWELDLWGKQRSLTKAAKAQFFVTKAARDLVRLTLEANVVNAYFLVLTLDEQLAAAKSMLDDDEETVKIYKDRYEAGLIAEIDLRRIEADMESVRATYQGLQRQLLEAQSALAVIAGRSPKEIVSGNIQRGKPLDQIILIPEIPEGIPSGILAKRPDVLQAEESLIAANAQIGAARASYFPSISLTGEAGYASDTLTNLITGVGGVWNLAANLMQPIFEGGKIRAQNKAAKAVYKEQLAAYQLIVQNAFKDVYDSLNANKINREVFDSTNKETQDMERSFEIAADQYKAGLIDTINLLDVKRTLLQARMNLASARYGQLTAAVSLSKALGGGWNEQDFKKSK